MISTNTNLATNWGSSEGGGSTSASDLTSGTLDSARLPTVPYTKGGTGLTALGTASQVLRTNAGATAAEWAAAHRAVTTVLPDAVASFTEGVGEVLSFSNSGLGAAESLWAGANPTRLLAPVAGNYRLSGSLAINMTATTSFYVLLNRYVSGSLSIYAYAYWGDGLPAGYLSIPINAVMPAGAGDYFTVECVFSSGTAAEYDASTDSFFTWQHLNG